MNRIALPTSEGFMMVDSDQIIRCAADGNYTLIILMDKQKIVVSRRLKIVESALPTTHFVRVHHSHLINLNHISSYKRSGGGTLTMINGDQVEVSRNKKELLLEKVNLI